MMMSIFKKVSYRRFDSSIVRYGIIFFLNVEQVMLNIKQFAKPLVEHRTQLDERNGQNIGAVDHLQHTTDSKLESMYGCFKRVWSLA